jgi:hypothetical protein
MATIMNERNYGSYREFQALGFADEKEAKTWLREWQDRCMGYSPLGSVHETTTPEGAKAYVVYCKVWNSCD